MKCPVLQLSLWTLFFLTGSLNAAGAGGLDTAEQFVDAFYSFDNPKLSSLMAPGADASNALYYQAWAQAAHYTVAQRRDCSRSADQTIQCAITVIDDFGTTLGYTATDTFTLTVKNNIVVAVAFEGDDPMIFYALYLWISIFRPEILSGPCQGMFEGGDTPAECASAVANAAADFTALWH